MIEFEHQIAVAAMRAAVRARRLRNQQGRAKTSGEKQALRQQAELIESEIAQAANLLIERASQRRTQL